MKATLPALCLITLPLTAFGQSSWPDHIDIDLAFRNSATQPSDRAWGLRLGAGVESEPTFQGSDSSEANIDPFVVAQWHGEWGRLFLSGAGLGYSRVFNDRFGLLLNLEAEDARAEDDDSRLRGLGDQKEELELEIVGRYYSGPWHVGASIAPATGDKGLVWFFGGGRTWRPTDALFVTINADLSGSSASNQRTDFGISAQQAANSEFGYSEYRPGGGLKSFGLELTADYKLSDRWFVYAELGYERLLGDVADSPLVKMGGSVNQAEAAIGLYIQF